MPFNEDQQVLQMWSCDVPRLALRFKCVLDALLAATAVHVHTTTSSSDSLTASPTIRYFEQALEECRKEFCQITHSNAEAVALAAILLQLQIWSIRLLRSRSGGPYALPLESFITFKELDSILCDLHLLVEGSNVAYFLRNHASSRPAGKPEGEVHTAQRYSDLVGLLKGVEDVGKGVKHSATYRECVQRVVMTHSILYKDHSTELRRQQIIFLSTELPVTFRSLLEEHDPPALALLAHILGMWKFVEDETWLKGVAKFEVEGIRSLMPAESLWRIVWPLDLTTVGLDYKTCSVGF